MIPLLPCFALNPPLNNTHSLHDNPSNSLGDILLTVPCYTSSSAQLLQTDKIESCGLAHQAPIADQLEWHLFRSSEETVLYLTDIFGGSQRDLWTK